MPVTHGIHVPLLWAGELGRWSKSRSPCSSAIRYQIRVNTNHDMKKLETNKPIVYLKNKKLYSLIQGCGHCLIKLDLADI